MKPKYIIVEVYMDYLQKMLKKTGVVSIVESVIFIVLGIVLIHKADVAIKIISYVLGMLFIIYGAVKVVQGIKLQKNNYEAYNYELVFGLMFIVIGIVTMYYGSAIETILRIIIGIWIIYSSLIKFTLTLKMRQLELRIWGYSFLLSLIMFICGLFIILNSGAIIATIGVIMIIYSVIDIIDDIICLKNINDLL